MATLTALNYYPVKACRGYGIDAAFVERRGLEHDRRFMVVDPEGLLITQRDNAGLALVLPALTEASLTLSAPDMSALTFPVALTGATRHVTVWGSHNIRAVDQGDEAAEWFSTYLETPARLVRMPADSIRQVDPRYAVRPDDHVSFADDYPILIASQESLDDLNARLATPVPMNRFRPNLVVTGCGPFEEDTWKRIRIGDVEMALVKPCARCEVTTIDQQTTLRGKEPLKTMATFRRVNGNQVMFGMHAIPLNEGRLGVGDPVEVIA